MSDSEVAIKHYTREINLDFIDKSYLTKYKKVLMVSGDRDLVAGEIEHLNHRYGAVVGDWESGAIAWIAEKNNKRLIILRGVTDLVDKDGGQAYGNIDLFKQGSKLIMSNLLEILENDLIPIEFT